MPTKTNPVKPVRVTYVCDICKKGELVYSNSAMSNSYSATYYHHCAKCGTPQALDTIYPYIDYQDIPKKTK